MSNIFILTKSKCPNGYSYSSNYADRIIRMGGGSLGATGGAYTHSHDIGVGAGGGAGESTVNRNLVNATIDPKRIMLLACSKTYVGNETYPSFFLDGDSCPANYDTVEVDAYLAVGNSYEDNSSQASHSHTYTVNAASTNDTGAGGARNTSGTSTSTALSAPYVILKLCVKRD